jgi:GxxExxY protein
MPTAEQPEIRRLNDDIIQSAYEVAKILGKGFLETVYERALATELELRGHRVERQARFNLMYKDKPAGDYVADMIVEGTLIVEVKVAASIEDAHWAQCLNYLAASGLHHGMVVNFGPTGVVWRKVGTNRTA